MNLFALKPHPFSQMFPPELNGSGFSELVASVKKLGRIRNSVIVYQSQILDGNRRLRACKIAKIEPKWIEFKGSESEALEMVWDLNYNRRDLTPSLRAVAFAQYCKFLDHGKHPNENGNITTLEAAAEKAHVSKTTMQQAKKVVTHGTKQQIESVKRGEATVSEVASAIQSKSKDGEVDVDATGIPVPEPALGFWRRKSEAKSLMAGIQASKRAVKELDPKDPMWAEVNLNGVLADLGNAINRMRGAIPEHVCPYCQGLRPKGCTVCKSRGVISSFMWSNVPEEIRKMKSSK